MGGGSSATAPADMQRVATDTTAIARRIDSFFLILNFPSKTSLIRQHGRDQWFLTAGPAHMVNHHISSREDCLSHSG